MEMPEQELPVIFSQMIQMFPNIPQEVVWFHVQKYSRDIEKCAQMLKLQNNEFNGLKPILNRNRNLNECNDVLGASDMLQSEIVLDNNNDVPSSEKLPLINNESDVKKGINNKQQTDEITYNFSSQSFPNAAYGNNPLDSSRNFTKSKFINFNEPLVLDIVPDDDDDILHSWRPNISADVLCSDLFVPSPTSENFQLNSNLVPSYNFELNKDKVTMNPEGMNRDPWKSSDNSVHMLHGYTQENGRQYEEDIVRYLHYQKSQMNVIWYEVIKAKIEQSDLKESVEKLHFELKEKMQSKSVQDIEELNEEIVQLRLECQCLCTEVDEILNNQGVLGEVDEKCYEKNNSSSSIAVIQSAASGQCTNSHREIDAAEVQDDSNEWQCPKCTFANHSAISLCEMCCTRNPNSHKPPSLHPTSNSCYCHPKEKSLSVQS